MIGPDGDVFLSVLRSGEDEQGLLLHFSPDLQIRKPPGAFGWDNTAAIVPSSTVPTYHGSSPYLIFSKYNSYGDNLNRMAILDPASTQGDITSPGEGQMREVLVAFGCTHYVSLLGVREWCVNAAAVNPATSSVLATSEDGRLYRWDLALNSLSETVPLAQAVGEPYVPTAIGPDGTVYALNGARLFAVGDLTNLTVAVYSSEPDHGVHSAEYFHHGQPNQ